MNRYRNLKLALSAAEGVVTAAVFVAVAASLHPFPPHGGRVNGHTVAAVLIGWAAGTVAGAAFRWLPWTGSWRAQRAYTTAADRANRAYRWLRFTRSPARRARLFRHLTAAVATQAVSHDTAWGPDRCDDSDGTPRTVADALRDQALLYGSLAYVEEAVADGAPLDLGDEIPLDLHAGPVLYRMAAEPHLPDRQRLLRDLYGAVRPVVGGYAAEGLANLPAPGGMRGWKTRQERRRAFARETLEERS